MSENIPKIHLVLFYSEGGENDRGINLLEEKNIVVENAQYQVDHIEIYTPKRLRDMGYEYFVKEYANSGVVSRNANLNYIGFCAWRPLILQLEMAKLSENDILVYRDINCNKHPDYIYSHLKNYHGFRESVAHLFSEYAKFDFLITRDGDFTSTESHCKHNIIRELGENHPFTYQFPLLITNFIALKKTAISCELLEEWRKGCENEEWINGEIYGESGPQFKWHTPEQGVLSVIIANWVRTGKHQIPLKYPDVILQWRDIHQPIHPTNYHYLEAIK